MKIKAFKVLNLKLMKVKIRDTLNEAHLPEMLTEPQALFSTTGVSAISYLNYTSAISKPFRLYFLYLIFNLLLFTSHFPDKQIHISEHLDRISRKDVL